MRTYIIEFTEQELDALVIQVGGRLDTLKELQITAGEKGKIDRVLELEKHMQPIISGKKKMQDALYSF